jgi:hypothetical protein
MAVVPEVPASSRSRRSAREALLCACALAAVLQAAALPAAAPAAALQQQAAETNILYPVRYIEERLRMQPLQVTGMERTRHLEEDRSRRVTLVGTNGEPDMEAHWKPVAAPGEGFNNEPRYELAAYRLQQLFLAEPDYVVAPTVLRALPLDEYRGYRAVRGPTVRGTQSVLFLLTYWIQHLAIDTVDPYDAGLFDRDTVYARHFANANLLTHLIGHRDGNHGNVVVSMNAANRRVFALDNDVAFRSRLSDQGDRWGRLHVTRLPASSIERLREISRAELEHALGVLAEFEIRDGQLHAVEHGPNLRADRGVRVAAGRVQFGLTRAEINDLERRIRQLLRDVERGRLTTF